MIGGLKIGLEKMGACWLFLATWALYLINFYILVISVVAEGNHEYV